MTEFFGKRIHIIGIGGTGMSPIAFVLKEAGAIVTGSDRSYSEIIPNLEAAGISVQIGHQAENIGEADLVLFSSAIPQDNPERVEAEKRNLPAMRRNEFLRELLNDRDVIAVAGTHGKTTTTSMLSWVLTELGEKPGFIIGSVPVNLHTNARLGENRSFVIEADEYDNMFLGLFPKTAILTRIEHDHPDCFPTEESYFAAFQSFLNQVKPDGSILFNADDRNQDVLKSQAGSDRSLFTYGRSENADFRAENLWKMENGCYRYDFVVAQTEARTVVELSVPGTHNVLNSSAALACCAVNGLNVERAAAALHRFNGIRRRFEKIAEWNDITIIDDYAHHPTEIQATLRGAREVYAANRIWAIWQPHTYSRTQSLLNEFCNSFSDADIVLVTDIYASREKPGDFGFADLKKAMLENYQNVQFADTHADAAATLKTSLQPGDVVVTLSAGDANKIGIQALEEMKLATAAETLTILKDEPISKYSFAMCGGPANELVIVESTESLVSLIRARQAEQASFKVVGGLSNILFSDLGFDGLIIINRTHDLSFEKKGDLTRIEVSSGMKLDAFVHACADQILTGMEWAARIPGTVGGAIYGNAGAYGGEIAKVLQSVKLLNSDGEIVTLTADEMGFGYRSSQLKRGEFGGTILSGTFELATGDEHLIHEKMEEIEEKRKKFNFKGNGSLGSVFRNPEGDYAGRLITACGYRGRRIGNVQVLDQHGNIFITYPGVKSSEFAALIQEVREAVKQQFGIDLTTEIEILSD